MSDIESRARALIQRAKDHGILDVKASFSKEDALTATSASQSVNCYISGRATPENANAFKSSLTEQDTEGIELDIDSSASALVPIDMNVFNTSDRAPVELKFEETDDKVYFLDFWATWCGPCQGPMAHNQKMLEENPHWEGKAEIVCISLDDTAEEAQKRIEEKGWNKVRSLWAGAEGFNAPAPASYDVSGIPTCLLVKNKKVLWKGHPSNLDIADVINGLIEGKPLELLKSTEPLNQEEIAAKVETIKKLLQEASASHPSVKSPMIYVCINKSTDGENTSEKLETYFCGGIIDKYAHIYADLYEKVNELLPGTIKRFRKMDTIQAVSRIDACSLCSKALSPVETQYLCLFCDPKHAHCEECENLPREGKGSAKLAHPHHIMKLHPEADRLDELIQFYDEPNKPLEEDPQRLTHGCYCDNRAEDGQCPSNGEVTGVRFKCLHCPDYDYCSACAKEWYENPSEAMLKTANEKGHAKYHVMVKIAFPNQ
jgi:thiol-disulfide isomerase/thioredoxin